MESDKIIRVPCFIESLEKVKTVSAGDCHSAAINEKGELFVWGCNLTGACGFPPNEKYILAPRELVIEEGGKKKLKEVKCGDTFTVVQTEENELFAFGFDGFSQLGNPSEESLCPPRKVKFEEEARIKCFSVGSSHCVAISEEGKLYSWGRHSHFETGHSETEEVVAAPKMLDIKDSSHKFSNVYCGGSTSFFVDDHSNLFSVGLSEEGQTGTGNQSLLSSPQRVNFGEGKVVKFAASSSHCILLI